MKRTLPSAPKPFRLACRALVFLAACAIAWPQEEDEESDEPAVEVIKQLVFIEQHLAGENGVQGIDSPYAIAVAPDGGHLYLASQRNDAITRFSRDEQSGELVFGADFDASDIGENALDGARSLALSPDGEFVYAVSMFANSLVTLQRDTTSGALSFVGAIYDSLAGVDGLDGARSVVVSPDGKNLYVAAYDESKLSVFSRNPSTGVASFLGVYEEGDLGVEELSNPHALAVSPDGTHLYVALWSNVVVVFSRDATTGLLSYESKIEYMQAENSGSSGTHRALAFSPDGSFLYLSSWNTDSVSVFSRDKDTGELTDEADAINSRNGVSGMDGPHALAISSDGTYLYVAAFSSDAVTAFERDAETGLITYDQTISAEAGDEWDMNGPISIGASPDGEHVYVGSGSGTHSVVTFRREILVDPPEFVVEPVDRSIEEGETVAFHALAQGVDLSYQWLANGSPISGQTFPVLTLTDVAPGLDGNQYSIRVSNPGGVLTSAPVTLTVLPPIVVEAPIDLTALDVSNSSARLSWKDQSDNETSFEIQRREPGGDFGSVATVLEDAESFEDASLSSSSTYIFRVRARRGESVSLWSNDAVIESFDDVPQPPESLRIESQSYNRVVLRWSDRSAVEDGFRVYRRADEPGAQWATVDTLDKNATLYEDRDVAAQSTYAYRVQAYNESGGSDFSNSVVALTSEIPVDSISPASRAIPKDGASGYVISVTADTDAEWEAISEASWLIVTTPTNGEGVGTQGVSYRALLNEAQGERIGTIVVGGRVHTVSQEGSPPFLRASPSRTEIDGDGGTTIVDIESNVDWTASLDSDWVSISSGQSGSDYGSIVLSVQENETFEDRFAELTINSTTHLIEQSGKVARLNLSLDPGRFDHLGGTGTVTVDANVEWSASESVDWIELDEITTGEGSGALGFKVVSNEGLEVRTADIIFNDVAITVVQDPILVSDVEEPEWVRASVGPLGVELQWNDLSDDETGFRLRRHILDTGREFWVADLDPDTTEYFDRDAPRGKRVVYSLAAFDAIGESDSVEITTELIPSAAFKKVVLKTAAHAQTSHFAAEIPIAGAGEVSLQRSGAGPLFSRAAWSFFQQSGRYEVDTDWGRFQKSTELPAMDWEDGFAFAAAGAGSTAFPQEHNALLYGVQAGEGSANPRGARTLGQFNSSASVFAIGFEIEGNIELPVLLQGRGQSLVQQVDGATVSDLRIVLYSVSSTGDLTELVRNGDASSAQNSSTIEWQDAYRKADARSLASSVAESRLLLMLGEGRYLAVLSSPSGSQGSAYLEVIDVR